MSLLLSFICWIVLTVSVKHKKKTNPIAEIPKESKYKNLTDIIAEMQERLDVGFKSASDHKIDVSLRMDIANIHYQKILVYF